VTTTPGRQPPAITDSQHPARLILHGVSLQVGELALGDLFLELPAGSVGAVLGRRASGKTTLLDLPAGVRLPHSGQVLLDGLDLPALVTSEPQRFWGTMVVRADRAGGAAPRASILDYVTLPLAGRQLDRKEAEQRARSALDRLGVLECAACKWAQLSAVQRAHAKLAQALAREPSLILIDDLIDGLPHAAAREAMRLLHDLAEERNSAC
jgi:ABC-type cobalamin/Fe3+-siderophores transport system ATPase subunit